MSGDGSLIPISDEQAKAIQEALKTLQGLGGFLEKTFGTVPQDIVALLGGNWLKVRRAENLFRILEKSRERLKARHVEPDPPSLSISLPIFEAAADESRDELQDIWSRLLAAAADPARAKFFRLAFVQAAKRLDSLDASVLERAITSEQGRLNLQVRNNLVDALKVTRDQIDVSVENLIKLDLAIRIEMQNVVVTAFGREFLRAVSD